MERHINELERSFETTAKWLAVAVVLALLFATVATAAPRAKSPTECGVAADMAIVARSLAQEQIGQDKAGAIMSRIYDVAGSERASAIMNEILVAAYGGDQQRSSQQFAEELFATCMKTGGDMDMVLGRRL